MEAQCSVQLTQDPDPGPYPEPRESNPYPQNLFI